eukprot:COSAG02_NODE_2732_length_8141_cov_41.736011_7_plen_841_part_00
MPRTHTHIVAAITGCALWNSVASQPCPDPEAAGSRTGFGLSAGFSDDMVLQRAPAKAAVYGFGVGPVSVQVVGTDGADSTVKYVVEAQSRGDGTWKAFLSPHVAGGAFTLTAKSTASGSAIVLKRVTFGDVYLCSGQSNMALETFYTFSADQLKDEVLGGKYSKLRLFEYGGMGYNCSLASWTPTWVTSQNSVSEAPLFKWYGSAEAAVVPYQQRAEGMMSAMQHFSATCLYFGVELLDALGPNAPPLGLIQTAVGGSTIEAWMANETIDRCTHEFNFSYGNPSKGTPIRGGVSKDQHIPGTLHYGYLAPFANTSVSGFLWYQGENNCGGPDTGNSAKGTGYGCALSSMVASWRELFSVEAGTTDPLAPFGIATLAAGGSEGAGASSMSGIRWSQTGNFGSWDNPALPNTFGAQLYDLADPWGHSGTGDGDKRDGHRINQTEVNSPWVKGNQTRCCKEWVGCKGAQCNSAQNASLARCAARHQQKACADTQDCALPDPATGQYGANCTWNSSLWWGTLKDLEPLVRKNQPSGIPGNNFMGGIHPRLKRPAGRRLAVAAVNLIPKYRAISPRAQIQTAKSGPTIAGCSLSAVTATQGGQTNAHRLQLHFNASLLGTESLYLRPWDADMSNWASKPPQSTNGQPTRKVDSAGLMVCTASEPDPEAPSAAGNASTCACSQWAVLEVFEGQASRTIEYCAVGPGWKPTAQMMAAGKPGRANPSPFAEQWTAVPFVQAQGEHADKYGGVASLDVDLSALKGRKPLAIRLGWPLFKTALGQADDMCCVHAASQSHMSGEGGGVAPCVPGNCPLYTSESELPANPFFAVIEDDGGKCACPPPQNCTY